MRDIEEPGQGRRQRRQGSVDLFTAPFVDGLGCEQRQGLAPRALPGDEIRERLAAGNGFAATFRDAAHVLRDGELDVEFLLDEPGGG